MRLPRPLTRVPAAVLGLSLSSLCFAQQVQGKIEYRILDVRDLVVVEPQILPATALEASFAPNAEDASDNPLARIDLSDLATLIMDASGADYWSNEGVEMRPEESGMLSIRCDERQHKIIEGVTSRIRDLLFEPILIEVHELPSAALASRRTILSKEEAHAAIHAAGAHPTHIARTTMQRRALIESKQIHNRLSGLQTRVANNAAAVDPVVTTEALGSSWQIRPSRTPSGKMLLTVSGSSRALAPETTPRDIRTDDKSASARIELATTTMNTCLSSARLDDGQALLVGSKAPNGKVLLIRPRRLGKPASSDLGALDAFPIANLSFGSTPGPNPRIPFSEERLFAAVEEERVPTVMDTGRIMELVTSQVAPDSWDGAPHTMHTHRGYLFVNADRDTTKAVHDQLKMLDKFDGRQYTLEVRFGEAEAVDAIITDDASIAHLAEALPQTCLSTVSPSRRAQISATRHSQVVHDYDSVVASGSAATYPAIGPVTEGFFMRGGVTPMQGQSVLLNLDMTLLSRDTNRAVINAEHPAVGPIDKLQVRENKVRGTTPVQLGNWTLLHLTPIEGGKKYVAITARVHAL